MQHYRPLNNESHPPTARAAGNTVIDHAKAHPSATSITAASVGLAGLGILRKLVGLVHKAHIVVEKQNKHLQLNATSYSAHHISFGDWLVGTVHIIIMTDLIQLRYPLLDGSKIDEQGKLEGKDTGDLQMHRGKQKVRLIGLPLHFTPAQLQ
jgi:hypothetical protein